MQMISDNNSVTRDWSFLHRNITRCLTKAPSFSFNFSLVDRTTQFIPSFRQRIKFHEHPREQIQEFHEMLHFLRQFKRRSKILRFLFSLPFRFIVRTSRSVARRSLQFQNATTNYARRIVGKKNYRLVQVFFRASSLFSVCCVHLLRLCCAPWNATRYSFRWRSTRPNTEQSHANTTLARSPRAPTRRYFTITCQPRQLPTNILRLIYHPS